MRYPVLLSPARRAAVPELECIGDVGGSQWQSTRRCRTPSCRSRPTPRQRGMISIREIPNSQLPAGHCKQTSVGRREADLDGTATRRFQYREELMLLIIGQSQRTIAGAQGHKRVVRREGGGRRRTWRTPLRRKVGDLSVVGSPDQGLPRGAIDVDITLGGPIVRRDVRGWPPIEGLVTAILPQVPDLQRAVAAR